MRVFTRFLLLVLVAKLDLPALEIKKIPWKRSVWKIPTKEEPIRMLGFTSRRPCHIIKGFKTRDLPFYFKSLKDIFMEKI